MKLIFRIIFVVTLASTIAFMLSASNIDNDKFTNFVETHPTLLSAYLIAVLFFMYSTGFCIYDLFKNHKPLWLKLISILLFFSFPLITNWIYFELYIFKAYFFAEKTEINNDTISYQG
jgi:hypothetical protein